MTDEFLSTDLWGELRRVALKAKRRLVVVPFVGQGASRRLPLRTGDLLVCRFDEATVRAGLTDPREILAYLKNNVEVHAVKNLHAKVFVLGRRAIVGSSNLSGNSEHALVEAAIVTSSRPVIRECRAFVDRLCGDVVGPEFAKRLKKLYRPPRGVPATHKHVRRIQHSDVVAVHLVPIAPDDYDEQDLAAERATIAVAHRRLKDPEKSRTDTFRWEGELPISLKLGVRVVQILKRGSNSQVYPPGKVLHVRRYTSSRGRARTSVCVELPRHARTRDLSRVIKQCGKCARVLKVVKHVRRLSDPELVYALGRVWTRSSVVGT